MTDDRLDLRLFESGAHDVVRPQKDDVHTRKTLPMSVNNVLMAAELVKLKEATAAHFLAPDGFDEQADSKEFVRIDSAVNTQGAQVLTVASEDDALTHIVWQGHENLHLLRADGSTFAIQTDAQVTALASVAQAVLVGCANGELYRMDVNTLTMQCMYRQPNKQAITCVEFFDDSQACLFLSEAGTVYICRDMEGQGQVRRLNRTLGTSVKILLLHKITKEFVWVDNGAILSGDLLGPQRKIDDCSETIMRGVFSNDGSLLYLLSDQHTLFVYSWVGDCRRLFQKKIDARVSDIFVSDANAVYGVIAHGHSVTVKPLA